MKTIMIMPCDYKKDYPSNWKTEIRPSIMKRAGEVRDDTGKIIQEARCEECHVLNHAKGARNFKGEWLDESQINGMNSDSGEYHFQHLKGFPTITTIVLTVAHLDHDKTNEDVQLDRLRAWCQRCHLGYDMPRHVANRKKNLKKKKGIIEMFTEDPGYIDSLKKNINREDELNRLIHGSWFTDEKLKAGGLH